MDNYSSVDDENLMYDLFLKREFQMNKNYDIDINNVEKIKEYRDKSCNKTTSTTSTSKDHQNIVAHFLNPNTPYMGLLLFHGTGSGKCHMKDTPIVLYDGTIKKVQDINEGDLLMGDDSTPRKVISLACGVDKMYSIIPDTGDSYVVNQEHILCLKAPEYPVLLKQENAFTIKYIKGNDFHSANFSFTTNERTSSRNNC